MLKHNDRLTVSLIALPFVLVMFIVVAVLINTSKVSTRNLANNSSEENTKGTENIWIKVAKKQIKAGEKFDFDIFMNTNKLELGAFAINLSLSGQGFAINTSQGNKGVIKGGDANNFILASNLDNNNFKLSGICAQNCAQGQAKHIATIHLQALSDLTLPKSIDYLEATELADTMGKNFDFKKYQGAILIK